LRFLRFACRFLKYSGPRLAISFPPFRPRATAAGSFALAKIQSNVTFSSAPYYARAAHGDQAAEPLAIFLTAARLRRMRLGPYNTVLERSSSLGKTIPSQARPGP